MTASSAAAQQSNWMQADLAKQTLITEINDLHSAIPGLSGPAQQDAYIHVSYYKAIYVLIDAGTSTAEAAQNALAIFDASGAAQGFARSAPPSDVTIPVTKSMLDALYKDAEDLLQ